MTGIRKNIWRHLTDRIFRREYVAEQARSGVAYQIKAMRESRVWSQADLAKKMNKSQSNIARLENPDYGKFSVQTLLEVADAFDVWLSVEFVPFGTGLARTANRSPQSLNVLSFDQEVLAPMQANQPSTTSNLVPIDLSGDKPEHIKRFFDGSLLLFRSIYQHDIGAATHFDTIRQLGSVHSIEFRSLVSQSDHEQMH